MKMMKMMKAVKKLKVWTKKRGNQLQRRTSMSTSKTRTTLIINSSSRDCCPLLSMHSAGVETETETGIAILSSSSYWSPSTVPSAPPLPPWLVLEHEDHEQRFNFAYPCLLLPCDETIPDLTTCRTSGGMMGCIAQFGIHVFRCFCPCFHVRDPPHHHPKLHPN